MAIDTVETKFVQNLIAEIKGIDVDTISREHHFQIDLNMTDDEIITLGEKCKEQTKINPLDVDGGDYLYSGIWNNFLHLEQDWSEE